MSAPQDIPPAENGAEPLARPRRTLWRRLGGEGLALSVLLHVLLVLIAIVWVVSTVTDGGGKKDPNLFATGAGGGAGGPKAKEFKTKAVPKNVKSLAKTNTRITSKNADAAVAISSLPSLSNPLLSAGAIGGGSSKGFGGGSGGGIGSGKGAGVGGGRNFVSMFGARGVGRDSFGIVGTFYDFKQDRAGKPTKAMGGKPEVFGDPSNKAAIGAYNQEVREFLVEKNFGVGALSDKFRSPEALYAQQIFIPPCPASEAPKAYGVEKKVKPSRWVAHYRGMVKIPRSGQFRFVGSGDDWMVVRFNGRVALDSGYQHVIVGKENIYRQFNGQKCDETHPSKLGRPMRCGPWIEASAGQEVPIDIVLGETPGGSFYAILCIEPRATSGQGEGLKLLRFSSGPLPSQIARGHPAVPKVDMEAKGWIFTPVRMPGAR